MHTFRQYWHFALAVFMFAFLANATKAYGSDQYWQVPVLYVTDRAPKDDSYGPMRLPEVDTVRAVRAGTVELSLPVTKNTALTDWQKDGIQLAQSTTGQAPKLTAFKCRSTRELKDEFDSTLLKQLDKCARKEIFVFVHGFNISFERAAENAAHLEFATGCPVVLYSWPSEGKLLRYSADECNNEWSQEHFNQFLEHLYELKIAKDIKINIVAHSMGNRLFVRATPLLPGKALFSQIYMVNPDFDAQTFIHYLSRYIPNTGVASGVSGQILISRKDKALSMSEAVFGGYTRLGQGVDTCISALLKPQLFSKVWRNPTVDQTTADGQEQKTEQDEEAARAASVSKAVSIVDVTALDHGFVGHTIPYEYISWMHSCKRPPQGFELQEDISHGCNRLSAFFARACGQKIAPPDGKFLIVTKSTAKTQTAPGL